MNPHSHLYPSYESPVDVVHGTRDWSPQEFEGLDVLEAALLNSFLHAGYERFRTPILEHVELHERRSGTGIVSKLFGIEDGGLSRLCLRPELTAGIVRAYTAIEPAPPLPWRVCVSGSVFRNEPLRPRRYREFQQVGVELLGASGPAIDGEVIWLADWSLARLGITETVIRLGHLGLVLEILDQSGLPPALRFALIEIVSEMPGAERNVRAMDRGLDQIRDWLGTGKPLTAGKATDVTALGDDPGASQDLGRLFSTLVPDVTGRRSREEVLNRLRRKWDLGQRIFPVIDQVRQQVKALSDIQGPARDVLTRLQREFGGVAPKSLHSLEELVHALDAYGIDLDRVELNMGMGRGLGFYSQMVFEIDAKTPRGLMEICGGGRYDGLARVLGSPRDDRGIGFSIGLERLWHALRQDVSESLGRPRYGFLIVAQSPGERDDAIAVARFLRDRDQRAVLETEMFAQLNGPELMHRAAVLALASVLIVRGPWRDPDMLLLRQEQEPGAKPIPDETLSIAELPRWFHDWNEEPHA